MKGHNEGSIRKRTDGRYEVRVTSGINFETGKSKRISYYAKTKEEAVRILHQAEYDVHINRLVDPTSTSLYEWMNLWLSTYMKNSLKQSTYVTYRTYIEKHFGPAIGSVKLKDLNSKLLQDFYNYKLEEGLSPKSIINMNLCLHKALKQAVLERYLLFNPCDAVILPKNQKPQIEILTREEQSRLMQTSYSFRYGVFIRLTLATGLRLGELLGLQWQDIDMRNGILHVERTLNRLTKVDRIDGSDKTEIVFQPPKSQNSIRSIPLMRMMINELMQWQAVQENDKALAGNAYQNLNMVVSNELGGYIEPHTFKDYYNRILESAGIGKFTFHALRHTFATRAMEQQMDNKTLSTILGHFSVSFTLDTYAHVLDSHKKQEMKLMEELFTSPTVSNPFPVIVIPVTNGYTMTAYDFNITVSAISVDDGIRLLRQQISQRICHPNPTAAENIIVPSGGFIIMMTLQDSALQELL